MNNNKDRFSATEELDRGIDHLLTRISTKYGMRIQTDSDYSKGTIKISIKEKPAI